jgi:predicted peptidase
MTRTLFIFYALSVTGLLLLPACTGERKEAGYSRLSQTISKDSADKSRNNIRSISNDLFEAHRYTGTNHITIGYRLLVPENRSNGDTYPLVLVLHGSGAVGTDNTSQLGILAKLWAQPGIRRQYPAFIVAPQFPQRSSNYVQQQPGNILVSSPDACLNSALQLIDSLQTALPVNKRKIYITGFSMGASSTINALYLRPGLFAAAIAVSGIPSFTKLPSLKQTPIWLIHGNSDTENPISSDSLFYRQLRSQHGRHVTFWEIDRLEHDIYPGLYTGEGIPRWLFNHYK